MGNAILLEAYYAERHKYLVDSIPTRHSTLCSSTWLIFTSKANTPSPKRRALQSPMKSGPKRQSHELIDIWPSLDPEIHRKTLCPTSKTYSDWTKTGQSKYPRPLHKWEGGTCTAVLKSQHKSCEKTQHRSWERCPNPPWFHAQEALVFGLFDSYLCPQRCLLSAIILAHLKWTPRTLTSWGADWFIQPASSCL